MEEKEKMEIIQYMLDEEIVYPGVLASAFGKFETEVLLNYLKEHKDLNEDFYSFSEREMYQEFYNEIDIINDRYKIYLITE